jgi:hypothetical protein
MGPRRASSRMSRRTQCTALGTDAGIVRDLTLSCRTATVRFAAYVAVPHAHLFEGIPQPVPVGSGQGVRFLGNRPPKA